MASLSHPVAIVHQSVVNMFSLEGVSCRPLSWDVMFGQTKIGVLQESRLARSPRYSATVEGQRAQAPVSRCSGVAAWHRCVEKHMLPVFIGTEERLSGLF